MIVSNKQSQGKEIRAKDIKDHINASKTALKELCKYFHQRDESSQVVKSGSRSNKHNQQKLERVIETKFAKAGMKKYKFPGRDNKEDEFKDSSLVSLQGVYVYDLHSQNQKLKRFANILVKPKSSSKPKIKTLDFSTLTKNKPTISKKGLTERSQKSTERTQLTSFTLSKSSKLLENLLHKFGKTKTPSLTSRSKVAQVSNEYSIVPKDLKKQPSKPSKLNLTSSRKELLLRYLKATKSSLAMNADSTTKLHRPSSKAAYKSLIVPSLPSSTPVGVKSFSQLIGNRKGGSTEKYKGLQLHSLGAHSASPETRISNSKSFVFGAHPASSQIAKNIGQMSERDLRGAGKEYLLLHSINKAF